MRSLVPESKIIFLTQETSADVVQEALGLGARGYVVKTRAQAHLLAAVEAALSGTTFVNDLSATAKFQLPTWVAFPPLSGTSKALDFNVEDLSSRVFFAIDANSFLGTVKWELPQSKQTKTFETTKTPGLSRFLRPDKWTTISAMTSVWLPDPHSRQDIEGLRATIKDNYRPLAVERGDLFYIP
jgi:hypothetical protein